MFENDESWSCIINLILSTVYFFSIHVATSLAFALVLLIIRLVFIQSNRLLKLKPDSQKAIIITGATSGFGLLASKHFHNLGFTVFACYIDVHEPGYRELLSTVAVPVDPLNVESGVADSQIRNNQLLLIKLDVRNAKSVEQAANRITTLMEKKDLKLHCLINNASVSFEGPFELSSRSVIRNIVETNLTGTLLTTRQFVARLAKDEGRIVFVGSGLGALSGLRLATYASTKAALHNFSRSLQRDLRRYNVKSVSILPTNLFSKTSMLFTAIKSMELAEKESTSDERRQFAEAHKEWRDTLSCELGKRKKSEPVDQLAVGAQFDIRLDEIESHLRSIECKQSSVHAFIEGSLQGFLNKPLEKCGVLDAYDDAVRLRNPPSNLYSGNTLYSFFVGPLVFELLPPLCRPLFCRLISFLAISD